VFIPLTVGGGIRKARDVRDMLNAGADKVAVNSAKYLFSHLLYSKNKKINLHCNIHMIIYWKRL
jgi:cyclase